MEESGSFEVADMFQRNEVEAAERDMGVTRAGSRELRLCGWMGWPSKVGKKAKGVS